MRVATAFGIGAFGICMLASGAACADWRVEAGIAYATGINDVADHYEKNLRRAGFDVDVDVRVPVGFGAKATYLWASDLRADIGLGPMFFISGDVKHFEIPISGTLGYSFLPGNTFSPYVRAGVVYHYVDGDQYSSTSPGLLAAVGVELTHITFEVATDRSEVEFDALACSAPNACRLTKEKLHTYDIIASVFYRF
jgi:hypothetical protein